MIVHVLIVVALLVFAVQAFRSERLLLSALWLAATSALCSVLLFLLGAPEVAVIELSVGAGLVTVLFVFAINIIGEEALPTQPIVPRPLAWILVVASIVLLSWMNRDLLGLQIQVQTAQDLPFKAILWESRVLDVLLQVVFIFAGVLGVLGLLGEPHAHAAEEGAR